MFHDLPENRPFLIVAAAALLVLFAACAADESADSEMHDDHDHDAEIAESADDGAPRVYFEGLENHDTIPSLVTLNFAAENFTIEPVGDGAINEGAGHYHIAIDGECLEPGIVIPTAAPWIHFGDGSSSIEIELDPASTISACRSATGSTVRWTKRNSRSTSWCTSRKRRKKRPRTPGDGSPAS